MVAVLGCPASVPHRKAKGRNEPIDATRQASGVGVLCLIAYATARGDGPQPLVPHKNDGDLRTRRPREGVASPSTELLLKIGPKTSGSQHLLIFTEEIRPGAAIPRHKHHREDEV